MTNFRKRTRLTDAELDELAQARLRRIGWPDEWPRGCRDLTSLHGTDVEYRLTDRRQHQVDGFESLLEGGGDK